MKILFGSFKTKTASSRASASFANASGGLLIIGIGESGGGVAASLDPVDDPPRLAQQLRDLSTQHIAERIEGLEIESRNTAALNAVLVRIPSSARRTHMVICLGSIREQTRSQKRRPPRKPADD